MQTNTKNILKRLFQFGGESDFGKTGNTIIAVAGLCVTFCLWWLISIFEIIPTKILPNPIDVIKSLGPLFSDYYLFSNTWFTVKLNLLSYFWAILLSFPIGFAIGLIPFLNVFIGKYINVLRFSPLNAVTALFIAVFGLVFSMKVYFLTVAIMIYIIPEIVNVINNLQNPSNVKDHIYLQTIDTLGATSWQKFRYVYWPYVTSNVANSIINLFGISYSYVVVAELIYKDGNVTGLGSMINTMIRQSKMPEAFAALFIIMIIGYVQDLILSKAMKKLFPYKYKS